MAVSPSESGFCRFWSAQAGSDPVSVDLNQLAPRDGNQSWLNYCIGVMALLRESGVAELPALMQQLLQTFLPELGCPAVPHWRLQQPLWFQPCLAQT